MSFESDIHVFICMGFVLVKLFDEWVYNFYNGGYLSSKYFGGGGGGWPFNVKYMVNIIFIDYLGLVKYLNC